MAHGPRRESGGRWVVVLTGVSLVALVLAAVATGGADEREWSTPPEPRTAFAQAGQRLSSADSFAYHGSARAAAASPVRPGLWLAPEVDIEGEVDLPSRSREIVVDDSGRAAEAIAIGPTVWARTAAGRDDLDAQPFAVASEGPAAMGAALMPGWLGLTTDRRRDGSDEEGRPVYRASLAVGPTDVVPDRPTVEGRVVLALDADGDPASVEFDGMAAGDAIHVRMVISGIGRDVGIEPPGGQELGVTGPVTPDEAAAVGIDHPVQLGRVPEHWVLVRLTLTDAAPSPGCSTLRLEYRHVDNVESPGSDYHDDESVTLLVTAPECSAVQELPNFLYDEPFAAGPFSGYVFTTRSFKSVEGVVSDGDTTVQFETDLDLEDARTILESLRAFDPTRQPEPLAG